MHRSRRTAPPRRSCSRSSRCCTSRGTASSPSCGPRAEVVSATPAETAARTAARRRLEVERGTLVGAVVVAVLLAVAIFALPHFVGADWITTLTSVAIYAVAALGFGILYGRVGMISLGQVALLT